MQNRVEALFAPLRERAARLGSCLREATVGEFRHGARRHRLTRWTLRGPADGGARPIRLGLFAAIHGDEPEGAAALCDLLLAFEDDSQRALGYELHVYPVCNPSGYEDGTRHSHAGLDLNREFWRGGAQPEVFLLECELSALGFNGLVALHADDTCEGAYAYVRGATLTEALARPALAAAAAFVPLASGEIIDGFPATDGLITQCYEGVLGNPAAVRPQPFEIIFETPQGQPFERQVAAGRAAVEAILREYRQFIAYGQDL